MVGLSLSATLPERDFAVELSVGGGRIVGVVGPNGSGKSTLLGAISGLLRPGNGRLDVAGRTLFDLPRVWVATHRRRVGMLTQEPRLFPHLDVRDNVAFGPRSSGLARRAARELADQWLARLGVAELADRRASALSGGQAQRVALARALATDPQVLLLDEPLSALDVDVAASMRQVLATQLIGRTTLLVTHDLLDVALLCDDVAVLEAGRLAQFGPTSQVMAAPRTPFAASLFGLNLIRGTAAAPDRVLAQQGATVIGRPNAEIVTGAPAIAVFPPAAVAVHSQAPAGSPRNVFAGAVTALEPAGAMVLVRVAADPGELRAEITPLAVAELGLAAGTPVQLAVKAAEVALYPDPGEHHR